MLLNDSGQFSSVIVNHTKSLHQIDQFFNLVARLSSPIPIVLLCERGHEHLIISSMKNGVKDCILKDELNDALLIRTILQAIEANKFELMNVQFHKQLEARAHYDFLTGLLNRYRFSELYEYEVSSARRYKRPLSVAMIDLDDFKRINDTFGHKTGDNALIAISRLLKSQLRSVDLIARFGGDEFVVIMPETDFSQAQITFQRICQALTDFNQSRQLPCELAISIGISSSDKGYDDLIERADAAMYRMKSLRKHQQATHTPPQS